MAQTTLLKPNKPLISIVFDLDETLVYNRHTNNTEPNIRNNVQDALKYIRNIPEVEMIVWTGSNAETCEIVLDKLTNKEWMFDEIISRDDKWFNDAIYTKDLRLLGRDLNNVIFFDNDFRCVKLNKANSIVVECYNGEYNEHDNTIINMMLLCEEIISGMKKHNIDALSMLNNIKDKYCYTKIIVLSENIKQILYMYETIYHPPHGEFNMLKSHEIINCRTHNYK